MSNILLQSRASIKEIRKAKNDTILQLRYQGLTLEQIGDELGISRQRVFQIIEKYLPELVSYDPCSNLSTTLGIRKQALQNWKQYHHPGKRWSDSLATEALYYLQCVCPVCGKTFTRSQHYLVYDSPECQTMSKSIRNRWKNWDTSHKLAHTQRVKHWKERNPEKVKEMNRRASIKYNTKKRGTIYCCLCSREILYGSRKSKYCVDCVPKGYCLRRIGEKKYLSRKGGK